MFERSPNEYEEIAQLIGDNIRRQRENRGLTQEQLGQIVYLSRQAIGDYERGYRVPNMVVAYRLSWALKIKPWALWR